MARVGKVELESSDPNLELLARVTEHSEEIYRLLLLAGVDDPQPRHFVLVGTAVKHARELKGLPPLSRDVVVGTFLWLIPEHER